MARKGQELRPVMTRIPEGLRRRLERAAKFRGRSMNAEIVHRLQESFDIPDQARGIAEEVSQEVSSDLDGVVSLIMKSLNDIRSEIRTILARLESVSPGMPSIAAWMQPKDDGEKK